MEIQIIHCYLHVPRVLALFSFVLMYHRCWFNILVNLKLEIYQHVLYMELNIRKEVDK